MFGQWTSKRSSPIGVDLGSRCVKLVQFDAAQQRLIEAVRWDLPSDDGTPHCERMAAALRRAREGRAFQGRSAVLCLTAPDLFIQNIRVPKAPPEELQRLVLQEAAGRIPFPVAEAEIRFLEVADVRQGDTLRREVIVLAVHQPVLDEKVQCLLQAGLRPVAVDVEPTALLRCYSQQYRRDEDRLARVMFVHVGGTQTAVVICEGTHVMFIKYLPIGGQHFDEAVAKGLDMSLIEAAALRRHNGDRRADQQDPDIARSINDAVRPIVGELANELSMCARYQSVTFRGQTLARMVLGGGEASPTLLEPLAEALSLKCELGDPFRTFEARVPTGRIGQWEVAAGLALRTAK